MLKDGLVNKYSRYHFKMIKPHRITIATILSLSLFYFNSCSVYANAETHFFKNNTIGLQMARPAGSIFCQQKSDSNRIQAPDFMRYQFTKHKTHKNPNLAFALAVFPGVCYHGVGHWYAGEEKTAVAVFLTGCVGMFVTMVGAMGDPIKSEDQMSEEEKKEDQRRRDRTVLIGGIIFLGSWVFDMVDAPLAAKRHNRKLSEEQNIIFKFELNHHNGFAGFRTYLLF